jgi:hypothetical protein
MSKAREAAAFIRELHQRHARTARRQGRMLSAFRKTYRDAMPEDPLAKRQAMLEAVKHCQDGGRVCLVATYSKWGEDAVHRVRATPFYGVWTTAKLWLEDGGCSRVRVSRPIPGQAKLRLVFSRDDTPKTPVSDRRLTR